MREETAKVAAKWWGDHLRKTQHISIGASSEHDRILTVMRSFSAEVLSPSLIQAWEEHLAHYVMICNWDYLRTQYEPIEELRKSVESFYRTERFKHGFEGKASINDFMNAFPPKTSMKIKDDVVMAWTGIGGKWKIIYPTVLNWHDYEYTVGQQVTTLKKLNSYYFGQRDQSMLIEGVSVPSGSIGKVVYANKNSLRLDFEGTYINGVSPDEIRPSFVMEYLEDIK